jgi:hypothetical protein
MASMMPPMTKAPITVGFALDNMLIVRSFFWGVATRLALRLG